MIGPRKQAGFTLIELMIALVLGLIVIAAVINMYVGSSRSSTFTRGLQTMQENGRYGVSALQRGLRLAGFSPDEVIDPVDVALSSSDSVTVVMQRSYDCNGIDTATSTRPGYAINTYALDAAIDTITCQGSGPGAVPMPLVEGVDSFRVLYGLDTDDDRVPESYVVHDPSMPANQIVSIRFALLVNSGIEIRSRPSAEEHVVLDEVVTKNDRFTRHVFSSTVMLRNRL